jgi:hypothetical protein
MVRRLRAGATNRKIGAYAARLNDADGVVQFRIAPFSAAAGVGIEQDGGFAHALSGSVSAFAFSFFFEFNPGPAATCRTLPFAGFFSSCWRARTSLVFSSSPGLEDAW